MAWCPDSDADTYADSDRNTDADPDSDAGTNGDGERICSQDKWQGHRRRHDDSARSVRNADDLDKWHRQLLLLRCSNGIYLYGNSFAQPLDIFTNVAVDPC